MQNVIPSGLHRMLTWRYILVTVIAVLVIEAILILLIVRFTPPYTVGQQPDVYLMEKLKREAVPYLQSGDKDGLQRWLNSIEQPTINLTLRDDWLRANLGRFPERGAQMLLVLHETDGVLASYPPEHPFSNINRLEELPGPLSEHLYRSIPEQPGPNGVIVRDGLRTVAAYPIQQEDGSLLALLILLNLATNVPPSWGELLSLAATSLLITTAAVGLLGGLFGYLSSRFLVGKVQALVETTAAWGNGDFSQPVMRIEQPNNELDQLADHLDQLRPRIQEAVAFREDLAVQSERQRIAQELHDSVKQQLFTLRMNLATAQTVNQKDGQTYDNAMQNAVSLAEAAQAELTSLIDIFHQPHSNDSSVAERLRLHVDEWSQQTGISAEQSIDVDLNLPLDLEHTVRRLLQEALANIFKHSGATKAAISVQAIENQLRTTQLNITIDDNGRGFDTDLPRGGFGLTSMHERVKAAGGSIAIDSSDSGTVVSILLPLNIHEEILNGEFS